MRRVAIISALATGTLAAAWVGYRKAGEAALRSTGYIHARDTNPDQYFGRRARVGMIPDSVAAAMPRPTSIERYLIEIAGGDSMYVERYIYRRGIGQWPVDVYYDRSGRVLDLYAWDHASLKRGRRVSEDEARAWVFPPLAETAR